jgi:hypothetical protein
VTPRSWEHWKAHYEQPGCRVLTPGFPGFKVEVEALNADPTPIENLTVLAVINHLVEVIGGLEPPILMGHSAGGYSPSSCWIAATARWAWRSTRLLPWACPWCRCRSSRSSTAGSGPDHQHRPTTEIVLAPGMGQRCERQDAPPPAAVDPPANRLAAEIGSTATRCESAFRLAAAVGNDNRRRRYSSPAARTTSRPPQCPALQREALQVQHRDRGQRRIPRLRPPAARPEGGQIAADVLSWAVEHARWQGVPQTWITHIGGSRGSPSDTVGPRHRSRLPTAV